MKTVFIGIFASMTLGNRGGFLELNFLKEQICHQTSQP